MPNIFILNNRWDASASEPECQESVSCNNHIDTELSCSSKPSATQTDFPSLLILSNTILKSWKHGKKDALEKVKVSGA